MLQILFGGEQIYSLIINNMNEQDTNLNFHYSRKTRIDNAPETVKKLYAEEDICKKGLIKVLTANKPLKFMFLSILILVAVIISINIIDLLVDDKLSVANWNFEITPFEFEDAVYFSINASSNIEKTPILASFDIKILDKENLVISEIQFENLIFPEGKEIKKKLIIDNKIPTSLFVSVSNESFKGIFNIPIKKSKNKVS